MNAFLKVLTVGAVATAAFAFNDKKPKYIDPANMDLSVKPGDNFYLYANGGWIKKNPIPASKTRWGSFDVLREESSQRLQALLQDAQKNTGKDRATQMIGDFYRSGMDSAAIEARGYTPIKADLDHLAALNNKQQVIDEIATMRTKGLGSPLFGMFIGQDRKNVNLYIPQLGQGGTTLPDRDYYLKDDARSTAIRKAYRDHVERMFSLIGENAANAAYSADAILRIETALAKAQMSRVEMRDPYKTYNKFSVKDLNNLTPGLNWSSLFPLMKVNGVDSVLVGNPAFLKTADVLITALPLQDWKTYLRWNVLKGAAPYLSSAFVNENFKLSQVLTGQKEQTPRWQRMSGLIDNTLGDLLGQLYVQKYFKGEAKTRMQEMVNNLQQTFAERIQRLDWMSEATKQRALQKLNAFTKKIAYPDKWKDYQGITINGADFVSNLRSSATWSYDYMVNRLGKPVDRTEWGMTPPTINAYYNPVNNEIAFPAGILQFPFFDFGADDAIIYGGIGSVIGHEMTHGFDDQGAQYGASGNLDNWWTKEDEAKFKAKTQQVVNQYNAYTVLDTIHVNGRLTLGENLADIGGLSIAYEAFTKTKQFKEGKKIDGFTPQQRFFLSWAQIWRNNTVPETASQLILTDPHSPGEYRANGAVVNNDAWYEAFNVQAGDKLYVAPEKRIKVW
ncbi:M13 family metallopeptidase [Flavisolibacter ginsenosidimutans]|uniref:M13 family metallopeptidase n=1 Tax=Flavisolibacter ginsenosidimutans TaxID=661481 RepID=A0A5B8ULL3_9BACT|nr:M13 family metallopeptidase [Flavisolibacter ginsenosidimutans]QEC56940.1 M13 family metallopeptidase [Flavisolibacter ginsenosidimutans]